VEEDVVFVERGAAHPRFSKFLRFLQSVAAEEVPLMVGEHDARYESHLLVALDNGEVAGAFRSAVPPFGPEARCPVVRLDGTQPAEAKIQVVAVRPASRGRGLGAGRLIRWPLSD
jgi:ribosomal protein S18 acetylase RimI-like enzyme